MSEENLKLLACPFCTEPEIGVRLVRYKGLTVEPFRNPESYIVCQDCGLTSPSFSTSAKAIAYWNTRRKFPKEIKKGMVLGKITKFLFEKRHQVRIVKNTVR